MQKMVIFALSEDGTLYVWNEIAEIRKNCEGVDVEAGAWKFFDFRGEPLKPVFNTPNRVKKHLMGVLTSVESSMDFDLVPDTEDAEPNLIKRLSDKTLISSNLFFNDVAAISEYLRSNP